MPNEQRQQLVNHIVGLIMQLTWSGRKQFVAHLAEHGLTPPQFYTLAYLASQQTAGQDSHDGCAMHKVADAVHQERPAMTGIVDRLERAGLVERRRSQEDRRKWLVTPTAEGQRQLATAGQTWHGQLNRAFNRLGEPELAQLEALLSRLVEAVTPDDASRLPVDAFAGLANNGYDG